MKKLFFVLGLIACVESASAENVQCPDVYAYVFTGWCHKAHVAINFTHEPSFWELAKYENLANSICDSLGPLAW